MRSNGNVTDISSAETNLASHLTSCAWRLQQGVEASRCSSHSASRAVTPLRQLCRIMVRYAPLLSQRPKPSRVIGRMREARHQRCRRQRSVFRRLQRCCERCRERRGMCLSVRGTFLSIYTAVPVRLAALPDALLRRAVPNLTDSSPHPCSTLGWSHWVVTPLSYYGSLKAFHVRFSTTITTSGVLVIRTVRKTRSGSQYTWYT